MIVFFDCFLEREKRGVCCKLYTHYTLIQPFNNPFNSKDKKEKNQKKETHYYYFYLLLPKERNI